jgi:hypothetical protein
VAVDEDKDGYRRQRRCQIRTTSIPFHRTNWLTGSANFLSGTTTDTERREYTRTFETYARLPNTERRARRRTGGASRRTRAPDQTAGVVAGFHFPSGPVPENCSFRKRASGERYLGQVEAQILERSNIHSYGPKGLVFAARFGGDWMT